MPPRTQKAARVPMLAVLCLWICCPLDALRAGWGSGDIDGKPYYVRPAQLVAGRALAQL